MNLEEAVYGIVCIKKYCKERYAVEMYTLKCDCPFLSAHRCALNDVPNRWDTDAQVGLVKGGLAK